MKFGIEVERLIYDALVEIAAEDRPEIYTNRISFEEMLELREGVEQARGAEAVDAPSGPGAVLTKDKKAPCP